MDTGLASGLIQMNARMVYDGLSIAMMYACGIIAGITIISGIYLFFVEERKLAWTMIALAAASVVMFIIGASSPRVHEIKACAYGPVSLEEVAARYEIVKVDGKELTLRVR